MTRKFKRLAIVAFSVVVVLTIVASVTASSIENQRDALRQLPAAPAATARLAVAHLAPFAPIPKQTP